VQIQKALGLSKKQVASLWLRYSYRVPPKIHAVAERLRLAINPNAQPSESVRWHVQQGSVAIAILDSENAVLDRVETLLRQWHEDGITSVAILCPNMKSASHWNNKLTQRGITLQVLDGQMAYQGALTITTLDAVRGLEFDGVLLLDVSEASYPQTDTAAKTLYTSMTRSRRTVQLMAIHNAESIPSSWIQVLET